MRENHYVVCILNQRLLVHQNLMLLRIKILHKKKLFAKINKNNISLKEIVFLHYNIQNKIL